MIIAGPALVESYAVLTRLPHPYRLAPHDAAALLTENFTDDEVEIVGLDGRTSAQLIGEAPYQHVVGGRIYDAVIAACAVLGGADTLLTFNRRHFETLAHPSIEVVVPA